MVTLLPFENSFCIWESQYFLHLNVKTDQFSNVIIECLKEVPQLHPQDICSMRWQRMKSEKETGLDGYITILFK